MQIIGLYVFLYLDKDPENPEPNAKQSSKATITQSPGISEIPNTKTTNMKWQFVSCRAANYADDINHLPDPTT